MSAMSDMSGASHYFGIEDAFAGKFRVTVRDAAGILIMTSTRLPKLKLAHAAIRSLCVALTRDWCYQIVSRTKSGPCFSIELDRPRIVCVSRTYSSGDAMEREIAALKARAETLSTIALRTDDVSSSPRALRQDDADQRFASGLRALA